MATTDVLPPPDITATPPESTKFERERAAFRRLLPELLERYRGSYVAIHDEQVVGSGADLISVAKAAYQQYGYQPIYVDLVTDERVAPIRIPYFKPV